MADALDTLSRESVDWRFRALPPVPEGTIVEDVGRRGWNVLRRDLVFPLLLLKETALEHNLRAMAAYCRRHRVSLAPHGKTTMAPHI